MNNNDLKIDPYGTPHFKFTMNKTAFISIENYKAYCVQKNDI